MTNQLESSGNYVARQMATVSHASTKKSAQPRYRNEKRSRIRQFTTIVFNRIREASRGYLVWSYFFAISVNDIRTSPFLIVYPLRIRCVFTIVVLKRTATCRVVYARGKMTWVVFPTVLSTPSADSFISEARSQ